MVQLALVLHAKKTIQMYQEKMLHLRGYEDALSMRQCRAKNLKRHSINSVIHGLTGLTKLLG